VATMRGLRDLFLMAQFTVRVELSRCSISYLGQYHLQWLSQSTIKIGGTERLLRDAHAPWIRQAVEASARIGERPTNLP
jgi:hypothetical protein